VTGKHSAWLASLPVVLGGCLAAHVAAYAVVEPGGHARHELLARGGHGYLAQPALLAAGALALLLVAVLHHGLRGRAGARPSPVLFAVLPPLAFAFQEHVERLLHTGAFPVAAALEPTFLIGLALQFPFALLAWVLARAVLRAAEMLGTFARRRRTVRRAGPRGPLPASASLPRVGPLAVGAPGRGPPLRIRPVL
jgi:hypothetical protein